MRRRDTLRSWFDKLSKYHGFGRGFMTAQVVADLKHVLPLSRAPDWWTFVASGPGSKQGMNRLFERHVDSPWSEREWRTELRRVHEAIAEDLREMGVGRLCAQNLQNAICEFDKYERVRLGGRLKRKYRPAFRGLF